MAVRELANAVEEALVANSIDKSELDWLVLHQANLRIISATAKKLNMGMDKVVELPDRHGNTFCSLCTDCIPTKRFVTGASNAVS